MEMRVSTIIFKKYIYVIKTRTVGDSMEDLKHNHKINLKSSHIKLTV